MRRNVVAYSITDFSRPKRVRSGAVQKYPATMTNAPKIKVAKVD